MSITTTALLLMAEPDKIRFGGGASESYLSPIVALALVVAGAFILQATRRKATAAFLAAAVLIPADQVLVVAGLHFPAMRILALFGLVRILREWRKGNSELLAGGLNGIDKSIAVLTIITAINGVLLWQESAALVFQLGNVYSAFGIYFLLRHLIRSKEDVRWILPVMVYITVSVAMLMIWEKATGRNPYYAMLSDANGSIYENVLVRDGSLRATGCFAQPILAGTFGAIMMPLFAGWWAIAKDKRKLAALGIAAATVISFAASSSTSSFAFIGGCVGLCFWPMRRRMKIIRRVLCLLLLALHLAMKAPVWHLISRVSLTQGSDSEHRYQLVNQCILHFSSWWLMGTKAYASWGWDMWDLGNQYVAIADQSGLIPLAAFVALFVFGFKYLGIARKRIQGDRREQLFIWGVGASLFANVVGFFGISYFDQTIVVWYALLAMISAIYVQQPPKRSQSRAIESPAAEPQVAELALASSAMKMHLAPNE